MKKKLQGFIILTVLSILIAGCGNGGDKDTITVSGKMWTEQFILTQMMAELLKEKTDLDIKVEEGLGEVSILTPALEKGDIDVYVEYTGTGLEAVLKEQAKEGASADEILSQVRKGYEKKFDVTWLKPLGFENTYTLAYTGDQDFDAKTFSDIVPLSKDLSFGAPHQFYEREGDGYDAFSEAYGFEFKEKKSFDPNIMYEAVKNGDVDIIPAFTTDGRIQRYKLKTTEDDKGFFPPYDAAPIIRQEVLKEHPEVKKVLNELAGKISEEEMSEMNAKVDMDKQDPKDVAREFLISKGLIKK
ncbi:ABC transporter substrate-binding protein [Rossellomorea vietnamensis]|jgi:osmoprotectant transport system substrate-binding protein|uniref:Glycine/betaine ABC transporter substrate-binding protein n=1 Tax=Rossellomorea vietnamensis TaxID=218284 RepID=A0A6I6UPE6_9BACI|nr:glycine betaine ABC transporter substrate-binding protein [Rossellomorea vietnamensis]OXS60137.1 glycine/betaine ABC transporter substrate-binding protein [Bacillus sp. DSM 27956]PRX76342.1 osmoprotectant transport system substrate-binding protein [Bacillus sp. V-88]MCC5802522.1 glycine/betaine ABC transporter substrate-binding protein [Rossellomorea vietnamensis]QHE61659.1 glycine/betaine ABC transporter substrate-binding protein [Rossellomorea vietnamensis]SLK22921.1 osmoprotectant transp